jgi:hypothetical protein
MKKTVFLMLLALSLSLALFIPAGVTTQAAFSRQDGRLPIELIPSVPDGLILSNDILISELVYDQYVPSVAYNSKHSEYLVVWENDWAGGHKDISATRVSAGGQVLASFTVITSSYRRTDPSAAYDPVNDRYLVVWAYDINGDGSDWNINGRFIPWSGPDASLTEFVICNWTSHQYRPVVAYGRAQEEFLVTWTNAPTGVSTYISARRVYANGTGFPANAFVVSSGSENRDYQDVTYNLHRNEYLVTWEVDKTGSGSSQDIYGIRLTAAGVALTGGNPSVTGEFPIAGWPAMEVRPAVAACDQVDQYLVGWQSDQEAANYAIYARWLDGDAVPGTVTEIDDTTGPEINVDVSCMASGKAFILAWQSMYTSSKYGILERPAYSNASLGTTIEIMPASWSETRTFPAIGAAGASFLVAWEHQRTSSSNFDIHGRLMLNALYLPVVAK